jgi:hypothetical protein
MSAQDARGPEEHDMIRRRVSIKKIAEGMRAMPRARRPSAVGEETYDRCPGSGQPFQRLTSSS